MKSARIDAIVGLSIVLGVVLSGAATRAAPPGEAAWPTDAGLIDVTKAPYHAKGDGRTDDTSAIQRAIDDYTGKRNPIYLPSGTYLVTDTLRWPENDRKGEHVWGFTHVQGQGPDRTTIRLKDATFGDPARPKPVMTAGRHGSADWFGCFVQDLTIETGRGNSGAIGLQFFSNNVGAIRSVAIRSGDGQGRAGLDLAYNDMNGPLLVKDLLVVGFEVGVQCGNTVNSQTFEHVEVRGQGLTGFRNDGQCVSLRDLKSTNAVPAVVHNGGFLVLIDSTLKGIEAAASLPALTSKAGLYARNVRTEGYAKAIEASGGGNNLMGPLIEEYASRGPIGLFPSEPRALGLPIRETPEVPIDDPATWANVVKFGADRDGGKDSSPAIQAAIDSGASTVYFPTGGYQLGSSILIRGKVRRLVGFNSVVDYFSKVNPAFRVVDGEAPVVIVEGFNPLGAGLRHESRRTLVVRDCGLRRYEGIGRGDLFVENVAGEPWSFDHQTVWARQLNAENEGTHIAVRGGSLWVLGLKTERGGTLVATSEGGKAQIDGGLSYTTTAGKLAPMFDCRESSMSASFAEVCYSGDPFATLIRETRQGETRTLERKDPRWSGSFPLYTGHKSK